MPFLASVTTFADTDIPGRDLGLLFVEGYVIAIKLFALVYSNTGCQ